jgi:hypothetical protein
VEVSESAVGKSTPRIGAVSVGIKGDNLLEGRHCLFVAPRSPLCFKTDGGAIALTPFGLIACA